MRILLPVSRRALLRTAGCGFATAVTAGLTPGAHAQQQITKTDAKYQNHPNGIQRCEICLQFQPPGRCRLVEGDISPNGWCQFFAAKENAQ